MSGEARVEFDANLGGDPEHKTTKDGTPFLRLSFCQTERRFNRQKNDWEDGEKTWWSAVEFDMRLAETYQRELHKGDSIHVEGVLRTRLYTDKNGQPQIDHSVAWPRIRKNLLKAKQAQGGFSNANPFNGVPAQQPQQQPVQQPQQNYQQPDYSQPADPWAGGGFDAPEF
ncbi:single-stranded DNA-binding protein [Bifidobacterium myosotis]|uniref:Single-stranded DNA-binding protein n=1 Tax=Bifidobacterium myosotis TaxID=1630166 RepID=A0A5M9ZHV7_9BIFI|nr:single-stranded DNA-binding protein [Bifidobacterium myosotis]KAA8827197.1 single-stranded DNA-binding protein [Bifidobacterium myosotis]